MLRSSQLQASVGSLFISKTIEQVVSMQLKHHLTVNEVDNINQSAFKTGHSTETVLLKITNEVKINLAQNKPTGVILLVELAVFDTIDHKQLSKESPQNVVSLVVFIIGSVHKSLTEP